MKISALMLQCVIARRRSFSSRHVEPLTDMPREMAHRLGSEWVILLGNPLAHLRVEPEGKNQSP